MLITLGGFWKGWLINNLNGYVYNLNKEIVVRAPLYSILRSLRYHNGDMWLKCCQKSNLFSSKIFANSLMHSVFLTVRHLPFSITCECCVEFKVKTWQNCCQGFLAKMVWKLAISHFSSVWEGQEMYKVFEHMCFAIGLLIRSFVWPQSCCCRRCGFLTLPNYSLSKNFAE